MLFLAVSSRMTWGPVELPRLFLFALNPEGTWDLYPPQLSRSVWTQFPSIPRSGRGRTSSRPISSSNGFRDRVDGSGVLYRFCQLVRSWIGWCSGRTGADSVRD
jgi:hypothetical protein